MLTESELVDSVSDSELDIALFEELVEEYLSLQKAFLRKDYEKTLNKTGKFCETAYQLLENITTGNYSPQPSFYDLKRDLENLPSTDYPDCVRILIPRLGKSVYDIRSRRGAVHKADVSPMFMDARLAVQMTRWILAEFLREYGDYDGDKSGLQMSIDELTTTSLPFVEEFEDGDVMILLETDNCREEVLLILYHFYPERVSNDEMDDYLDNRSRNNVVMSLKREEEDRRVHRNNEGSKLTRKGRLYVETKYGVELKPEE